MGQISAKLRKHGDGYAFWCPACEEMHAVNSGWKFNGDLANPTFSPSVHVSWTNGATGQKIVCHFFLTDGVFHFCEDSTHALAGKTVPLPDLPDFLRD